MNEKLERKENIKEMMQTVLQIGVEVAEFVILLSWRNTMNLPRKKKKKKRKEIVARLGKLKSDFIESMEKEKVLTNEQ